jgi:hypothetical protein
MGRDKHSCNDLKKNIFSVSSVVGFRQYLYEEEGEK